ncbi:YqcC family protein [Alkalimarinus alittae]|uniref:YqcC family protein n=1 Tax=Alkalimarinus alittae TaxID=2961619 RepID=A0ABY6MYS9_9ALTE|nr:YqcC family protein [Alkalimarinus alittae]UZE94998.1 YqcC family protein [Alkalimarinus alittae]
MHSKIANLLREIEIELRQLGLWSDKPLEPQQLMSVEPFCIDTMTFPEWVQFVFIARLKFIIAQGAELPKTSDIAPMAEEFFKVNNVNAEPLISLIKAFDQLITEQ